MEHQSVIANEAPSDEFELSTTSSISTRSSLSPPTSSESNPSPAPPLPSNAPAPDLQHAEQNISVIIVPATAPSAPGFLLRITKEQALKSIKESIPHAMMLQQLQKSERAHQKQASLHKKQVRRLSKELYMVVSLYALPLGVLFTAVAQSSVFSCADWWGPIGIAFAAMIGAIFIVSDKLRRMGFEKQEAKMFEWRQSAVYDKLDLLYFRGSYCDIDALQPEHTMRRSDAPSMKCIFSLHGLLVMGFLVGFSVLIMVACTQMLCHPCRCTTN